MLEQDLVSIITPSYNTEKFIIDTIESVKNQTYKNWEMIIVDDCSSDHTISIVNKYISETGESRIHLFRNEKNSGAALTRNRALREAKGRWIAFLDSDDLWLPEKLEKQIKFMKEKKCSFSYTKYCEIDENSKTLNRVISGPKHITKRGMYNYCWPGCLTVMYDANVVGLVQIPDLQKNNDYAMWLQIVNSTDCYLLEEILAQYRKRDGSISNMNYWKLIRWHFLLFREEKGIVTSTIYTCRNLVFGLYKKMKFVTTTN